MKKKAICISIWYFAVASLCLGLFYSVLCFISLWAKKYYIGFAVFIGISIVLFLISYKTVMVKGSYTLLQNIGYYRACKRYDFNESYSNTDRKILEKVSMEMEILVDADASERMIVYHEGKELVESVKNPIIVSYWKYSDRLLSIKNKTRKDKK